jgi:hypothetical protein
MALKYMDDDGRITDDLREMPLDYLRTAFDEALERGDDDTAHAIGKNIEARLTGYANENASAAFLAHVRVLGAL